jgi:hypothetical protein
VLLRSILRTKFSAQLGRLQFNGFCCNHFCTQLLYVCFSVKVVLGTMGIPAPLTKEMAAGVLDSFAAAGHQQVDTAIMYQGGQ